MAIKQETIKSLLGDIKTGEELFGQNGLLKQLTKQLVEGILAAEMSHHLGYEKHEVSGNNSGNSRNGSKDKQVKTGNGELVIEVARDRNGEFEPQLIKKRERRLAGLDEQVLGLYGRGMTVRDIESYLEEL